MDFLKAIALKNKSVQEVRAEGFERVIIVNGNLESNANLLLQVKFQSQGKNNCA